MAYDMNRQLQEMKNKRRRRSTRQKVVGILCCVVAFCVVYLLMIPAVSMTKDQALACPYEVHQHDDSCLDGEGHVICGYADYVVHTHDPDYCYDSEGNLVCLLEEIKVHTHDDSCYTQEKTLVCGMEESYGHAHSSDCYASVQVALVCQNTEHEHTEECYEGTRELTCGKEAGEGAHTHDESCYEVQTVLTCEEPEVILHTHSADCYEDILDEEGNLIGQELICGKLQVEEHQHDKSCLTAVQTDGNTAVNSLRSSARIRGTCEGINYTLTPASGGGYRLLLSAGDSATIPSGLFSDETLVGYKDQIGSVEIGAGITEIGTSAFANLSALRTVSFDEGSALTTIGSGAFAGCGNLNSVNLEDCASLSTIASGDTPETGAFSGTGLTQVTIPASVTTMGDFAFFGCQNLSAARFAENTALTNMGAFVFAQCTALESVNLENLKGDSLTFGTKDTVTIGGTTIESGSGLFYGCTSLQSLTLPNMSGSIAYLCKGCSSLTAISLDNCAKLVCNDTAGSAGLLHFIEDCDKLETLDLSGVTGMTTLYQYIVQGGVKTVILPPTLTRVAQTALGWTNVEEVVFTNDGKSNLKQIGGTDRNTPAHTQAFASAAKLKELHLEFDPDAQQSELFLLTSAFLNCPNLETISISSPAGLQELGEGCFADCKSLQNLTWDVKKVNTVCTWGWSVGTLSENIRFTIGPNVEVLPGYLLSSLKNNIAQYILTPESSFFVTGAAGGPFTKAGCYYADENGNLYRLNGDSTAELVYANRSGSGNFTVPPTLSAKLCTASGRSDTETSFTVTRVCQDAFMDTGYSAITFTAPEKITAIESSAFAGAYNLQNINELTMEQEIKALFTAATLGRDLFVGTKITSKPFENSSATAVDENGNPITYIAVTGNLVQISAAAESRFTALTDTNHLATGETAGIAVGISNESSERRVRIYLKVSDPASFTLPATFNNAARQNTADNGVFFYDVLITEGADPIWDTLGVTCDRLTAPGKKAYVWLLEADNETVLTSLGNTVVEPGGTYSAGETGTSTANSQYIELTWDVVPKEYSVVKALSGTSTPTLIQTDGDESSSTVVGLSFLVSNSLTNRETADGNSYDTYGADFVKSVRFSDVLTLDPGLKWREGLLDAEFTCTVNESSGRITATIGEEVYNLCTLTLAADTLTGLECVPENGNLKIIWTVANRYTTTEVTAAATTLTYGPQIIMRDTSVLEGLGVKNTVTAVPTYTYSGVGEPKTAEVSYSLTAKPSPLAVSKEWVKQPVCMGEEAVYRITLDHVWDANATDDVDIYDDMGNNQHLASDTIENMLLGNGHDGDYLTITINNAVILPVPASQEVTAVDGETKAQTTVRNAAAYPEYNDLAKEYRYTAATLTMKKSEEGILLTVAKTGGEATTQTVSAGGLQDALDAIGYVRSIRGSYVLHWHFPQGTVQAADTHKEYELHALVKNSFQMMTEDHNASIVAEVGGGTHTYPISNKLYTSRTDYESGSDAIETAEAETTYDLSIDMITKVGDESKNTSQLAALMEERLQGGGSFLIDYSLDIWHYGAGTYGLLPVVDHMTGIQALLAEVEDNAGAAWITEDIPIYSADGKQYYVLNANGAADGTAVYSGVWLENGYADSVTVTKTEYGLDTLIKWYYIANAKNRYNLTPAYRAICSATYASGSDTDKHHFVFNEAWLNDIPTRRLHDNIGAEGVSIAFEKHIVTEKGATPAADTLWGDTTKPYLINDAGTTVTYRLDFVCHGTLAVKLTGEDFYDILPAVALKSDGSPVFVWSDENVTVSYQTVGDGTVSDDTASGYDIVREAERSENYRICWNDGFSISFPPGSEGDAVYVYVQLTFPVGEQWAQYLAAKGNTILYNSLYVRDVASQVSHVLPVSGEAMLRKGVYETGYYVMDASGNTTQYFRDADRNHYVRTAADVATVKNTVTYFVTLYNSSDTANLYLSPIYDLLPEGFTFYSLVATPVAADNTTAYSGSVHLFERGEWAAGKGVDIVELTAWGHAPLAKPATAKQVLQWNGDGDNRTVRVRSPYDTQTLIFDVVLDDNHQDALGYYLKPGEAIQFGYMCFTGDANVPSADNRCAMEYLDYSNSGVTLTPEDKQTVTVETTVFSAAANTGTARLIDNTRAAQLGFTQTNPDNPAENRQWLISRVSLTEGDILPGITTEPDTPNVEQNQSASWSVNAYNSGTVAMRDYTIANIIQSPLCFKGKVGYTVSGNDKNTYSYSAELSENKMVIAAGSGTADYLFEITEVAETEVTLVSNKGETLTVPYGQEQALTVSVKTVSGGTEDATIAVSFTKAENGDMTMSIRFSDAVWSIPANGVGLLSLSTNITRETTGLFVNNATITPNTQSFDSGSVTQGTVSADGKSDSSAASVNVYKGILTTAYMEVTSGEKYGVSGNYEGKGDNPNRIVIDSKTDTITYTMNVNGVSGGDMQKLVVIDTLPQWKDTNPINDNLRRDSQFKVNFAENRKVRVIIETKAEDGVTILSTDELSADNNDYTVQYSSKISGFDKGTDYASDGTTTPEEWHTDPETGDRSIRVVIDRQIAANETVKISFDAQVDQTTVGENATDEDIANEALSGEVAWNNFGYSFQTSTGMWLYAAPQKVGVSLKSAPTIAKALVNSSGTPVAALEDATFRFVVYEGSGVDFKKYDAASVEEALRTANKKFTFATVTVKQNDSYGELMLNPMTQDGTFTAAWTWVDGETYTVVEIDESSEYAYRCTNAEENTAGAYTFTYDETKNQTITVYNTRHNWRIALTKTNDKDESSRLPGAVFGLYSATENPDIVEQFASFGLPENTATIYIAQDETVWYLSQIAVTGIDGMLTWEGLCEDRYLVLELRAPDGYIPSTDVFMMTYGDARKNDAVPYTVSLTVKNAIGYELPESGGFGTGLFTIVGLILLAGAGVLLIVDRRRKA